MKEGTRIFYSICTRIYILALIFYFTNSHCRHTANIIASMQALLVCNSLKLLRLPKLPYCIIKLSIIMPTPTFYLAHIKCICKALQFSIDVLINIWLLHALQACIKLHNNIEISMGLGLKVSPTYNKAPFVVDFTFISAHFNWPWRTFLTWKHCTL